MRSAVALAAIGLALIGLGAFSLTTDAAGAEDQTVDSGNNYFCSSAFQNQVCETQINAGDRVTWNVSAGFHTVTQCDDAFAACPPAGGFDSGDDPLTQGDTFAFTFTQAGAFAYYCAFHPTEMRGRVVVAAQITPAPTAAPTTAPTSGATAAPSTAVPAAQTPVPVSVPRTGGPPADAGTTSLWLLLVGAGAMLVVASSGLALATARKQ